MTQAQDKRTRPQFDEHALTEQRRHYLRAGQILRRNWL